MYKTYLMCICVILGILSLLAVTYAVSTSDDYQLHGGGIGVGGAQMESDGYATSGQVQPGPVGESEVQGEVTIDPPAEPTTLKIVFKPANSTTLVLRQGDYYAMQPNPSRWQDDPRRNYLLWTK